MDSFYMFEQKNTMKKIMSGIALSCMIFLPSIHFASEHESAQEKKQTKYDATKTIVRGLAQGYGTYLGGTVAHEFGHWLTGKMIHRCNGFFYVHPNGTGGTYHYYSPTNKYIIKNIFIKAYLNKDHKLPHLKHPKKYHPLMYAAGPFFGIGYNLLVQRMALQSCINNKNFNMLCGAIGTHFSLTANISNFSPFATNSDGNGILQYFNINCPTNRLADVGFHVLATSAALMLGAWNIKAVLPATT